MNPIVIEVSPEAPINQIYKTINRRIIKYFAIQIAVAVGGVVLAVVLGNKISN